MGCYFGFTKWFAVTVHSGYNPPPFDWISRTPSLWWIACPTFHEDHHFSNIGKLGALTTVWDELHSQIQRFSSSLTWSEVDPTMYPSLLHKKSKSQNDIRSK